jgi:GDP-L-fucose synthase
VRTLIASGVPEQDIITRTHAELDLRNQAVVQAFFQQQRPAQVYLAAAKVGGIHANNTYPADFIYDNLMVQANVIDAAHRVGVQKLLFLGSSCIYPRLAAQPMAEDALLTGALEPTNEPYAIAKIAGIKMCESYNRQHGRDYRSVMPTNLYGPGDNYHPENSHVIPALIRRFHEAKMSGAPELAIWGSGTPRREFLYVDDMAAASAFVMNLPLQAYKAQTLPMQSHLNVGFGSDVTIAELAQVVIWIGFLQWTHHNGFAAPRDPILQPIDTIRNMDAIIDLSDPDDPEEPEWPEADVIVGNPPFLGNRMIAAQLGKDYVKALSRLYEKRMEGRPDICCYWFEKANAQIVAGRAQRAGLLATQAIRGGTNRVVVQRIIDESEIFYAISDQEWILDGAAVHISMIGFSAKGATTASKVLDGKTVPVIHANLTAAADSTSAHTLKANADISFQGGIKRGSFDMPETEAIVLLQDSGNPNHRPNSDVLVPYINGLDIARRPRHIWVVDFGDADEQTAAVDNTWMPTLRV